MSTRYLRACSRSGRNEMDPPLCGSTAMSHHEFQIHEPMEPQEASPMKQEMHVLGIDIAKRVFHAVGMDDRDNVVYRTRLSRHDLMPFIATLPPVLIGMEACGGAHDWARRFREHGHEVKLMAPQFVKPYTYCISRRNFFGGKQLWLLEGAHRATRCAIMHGARGD